MPSGELSRGADHPRPRWENAESKEDRHADSRRVTRTEGGINHGLLESTEGPSGGGRAVHGHSQKETGPRCPRELPLPRTRHVSDHGAFLFQTSQGSPVSAYKGTSTLPDRALRPSTFLSQDHFLPLLPPTCCAKATRGDPIPPKMCLQASAPGHSVCRNVFGPRRSAPTMHCSTLR